jgi:hypothetical protein
MSINPEGSGWWVASDGRWYPPESHPSAVQTVPAVAPPMPTPEGAPTPSPFRAGTNGTSAPTMTPAPGNAIVVGKPKHNKKSSAEPSQALPFAGTPSRARRRRRWLGWAIPIVGALVLGGIAYFVFNRHQSTPNATGQTMVVPCAGTVTCVTQSVPVQSAILVGPKQNGTTVAVSVSGSLSVEVVGQGWQVSNSPPGLILDSFAPVDGDTVFRFTAADTPGGLLQLSGPTAPGAYASTGGGAVETYAVNVGITQ